MNDDSRRCTAMAKSTGERCKRRPIPGGFVCVLHGGAAPQTRDKARRRLLELVDPALATLAEVLREGLKNGDTPSAVRSALGILDRAGLGPSSAVEVSANVTTHHATVSYLDRLSPELRQRILAELEGVTSNSRSLPGAATPRCRVSPMPVAGFDPEEDTWTL